jgi:GntR family transcriptional regulator, transcriptional repressor for pyruvate dehydrogenase complex
MVSTENIFPKFNRDRIFEQVSEEIKKQIFKNVLKPGDRLPSEKKLAENFNVSRQTIREALRILELSGFITVKRGVNGGPIIENTILNRVSQGLYEAIQLGPATLNELLAAWRDIEKVIMVAAVRNADENDIRVLGENIIQAKETLKQHTPIFKEIIKFHQNIAKASKNHIFEVVLNSIMAVYTDFLSRIDPDLEEAKKVILLHEGIYAAIVEKNETRAVGLFEKHLQFLKQRFQSIASL